MIDVLVVGAGPTGLLLAGDLAEAGAKVTVLERRGDRVPNLSRSFAVHARTLELLDARGLADDLLGTGAIVRQARLFGPVRIDLSQLPSRFPFVLITPQYTVEKALLARACQAGAEIAYHAEVVALRPDAEGVDVDAHGPDGSVTTHRARYVVGADGVHSAVRRLVGMPFPGKSVLKSMMLADVRLAEKPAETITADAGRDGFVFIAPFGDGWYRAFAWDRRRQLPDDAPVSLTEIAEVARRVHGTDLGMHEPRWMSRFHSDERQVPNYRIGRVFLAGDAAHCHSPAGGQGMNTGLQDAANLSWKLAAVLRGAPDRLLDTYQTERHPVGRRVVRSSGAILRFALLTSRLGPVLRAALLGLGAWRIPAITRRVAGQISGVGIGYGGRGRLVGTRVPDLPLADGTRLYQALRGGKFVLIDAADVRPWQDRVRVVQADAPTMLVRPDGYIGWAGESPLRTALAQLCGLPENRHSPA